MEDKKQIKITASEERRRAIKSRASAEGITVQDLLDGWLDEWLAGKKMAAATTAAEAMSPVLPTFSTQEVEAIVRHRDMVLKVVRVLDSGDQRTIDAIVPNIEIFDERLQPRSSAGRRRAAVGE
jgi:hypothetical protein